MSVNAALRAALERHVRDLAPARRLRMLLASEALARFADGRPIEVLDAGCEVGLLSLHLAERFPHWRITGIDVNDAALTEARRWAAERGIDGIDYRRADVTADLGSARYDAVAALEILAEIPAAEAAAARMAAALRPGGLFLTHVPERHWRPVLRSSPTRWPREVRHGYAPDDVRALLAPLGMEEIEIRPSTRGTVQLAAELRDRIRDRGLKVRAAAWPLMRAAVAAERRGLTWGEPRAWFVTARKAP